MQQEIEFDNETMEILQHLQTAIWDDWPLVYEMLLGHTVKYFHKEWVQFQLDNPYTILLGPRGFGKTQTCTKDYAILKSLRSRNERILILGKTLPQARGILREIRMQLERNQLMQLPGIGRFFDVPEDEHLQKTQTELFFSGRTEIYSEANISALGLGGTIVSGHYSCILADDLVDDKNSSGGPSERDYRYVKQEVLPMLLPGGEFHIIGSSWGSNDPYQRMIKGGLAGTDFKWRKDTCYKGNKTSGESIWPEWISTEELNRKRLPGNVGEAFFRAQYLNDTDLLERRRKLFFEEDIQIRYRSEVMRRVERITIGVDPATGEAASWTGIVILARVKEDPDWPRYWILEMFKEKFGSEKTEQILTAMMKKYTGVEVIVVEANAFQLDFANRLSRKFPVEKRSNVKDSKDSRAMKAGLMFQQGAVGCCEECKELLEDFYEYPDAQSRDLIDAWEDAYDYVFEGDDEGDYEDLDLRSENEIRGDKYKTDQEMKYTGLKRWW